MSADWVLFLSLMAVLLQLEKLYVCMYIYCIEINERFSIQEELS